jgi:methylmalonyl-CoA mutase, N-terminal domain
MLNRGLLRPVVSIPSYSTSGLAMTEETMTLQDQYNKWKESTLKRSLDRFKERKERFETSAGIEVPRVAMPGGLDDGASSAVFGSANAPLRPPLSEEESYLEKLGFPGEYPYTRGVQPTMYRSRFWTMRQYAGFSTAEDSNKRYRYLLGQGQTGLSLRSTSQPRSVTMRMTRSRRGEVGKVGVSISSITIWRNCSTRFRSIKFRLR